MNAYAIDPREMLIHRDVTVNLSVSIVSSMVLKASTRFGLGILRNDIIANITNIKTTLSGEAALGGQGF